MVCDPASFRLGGFRGTNVHAPVDQHRIRVDHLGRLPPPDELAGQRDRERRLARRSWSDKHYQGRMHGTILPVPVRNFAGTGMMDP